MKNLFAAAIFILTFAATSVHAGDEGLYAPPPPPGSAFVRFINGDTASNTMTTIRGKPFHNAVAGDIGDYYPIQQGDAVLTLGTSKLVTALKAGTYYSAVLAKGAKLTLLEEPAYDPKLKSQLILLNLTTLPEVSLTTPGSADSTDGTPDVTVIDPVKPGALGARAVNAVKAGFSVTAGTAKLADLAPRPLERGASYAVVVYFGADGKPTVNYNKANTP